MIASTMPKHPIIETGVIVFAGTCRTDRYPEMQQEAPRAKTTEPIVRAVLHWRSKTVREERKPTNPKPRKRTAMSESIGLRK